MYHAWSIWISGCWSVSSFTRGLYGKISCLEPLTVALAQACSMFNCCSCWACWGQTCKLLEDTRKLLSKDFQESCLIPTRPTLHALRNLDTPVVGWWRKEGQHMATPYFSSFRVWNYEYFELPAYQKWYAWILILKIHYIITISDPFESP